MIARQAAFNSRTLSRRAFIRVSAIVGVGLLVGESGMLTPPPAYAWDSYHSGIGEWVGKCDPMHDDMTQICFGWLCNDLARESEKEPVSLVATPVLAQNVQPENAASASPSSPAESSTEQGASENESSSGAVVGDEAPASRESRAEQENETPETVEEGEPNNVKPSAESEAGTGQSQENEKLELEEGQPEPEAPEAEAPAMQALGAESSDEASFPLAMTREGETRNILEVATEEEYAEVKNWLRNGAFWNDVSSNSVFEFVYNYLAACYSIPKYSGDYQSAFDVATHVKQANDKYAGTGTGWPTYWYYRALTRFSMNKRANLLHSMLGVEADGETYLTQEKERLFTMEWLEAAYKYVTGEVNVSTEQSKVAWFVDPYNQVGGTSKSAEDADKPITERQAKLRAIGMMCHTLEDSCNPAHSIRSYHGLEPTAEEPGPILAFGNYEAQDIHADYDHIVSKDDDCPDMQNRKNLRESTDTLAKAKELRGAGSTFKECVNSYNTLGLALSMHVVRKFLGHIRNGDTWDGTVGPWLETVFAMKEGCLDDKGDSLIYDGGRRAGKLKDAAVKAKTVYSQSWGILPQSHESLSKLNAAFAKLFQYRETVKKFHHDKSRAAGNLRYHLDESIEREGQKAAQDALDALHQALLVDASGKQRDYFLRTRLDRRMMALEVAKIAGGVVQEFSFDLDDRLDSERLTKTQALVDYLTNKKKMQVSGSIECMGAGMAAVRLEDGSIALCTLGNSVQYSGGTLSSGLQNVDIDGSLDGFNPCLADVDVTIEAAAISGAACFMTAIGVLVSVGSGTIAFIPDGMSEEVSLSVADSAVLDGAEAGKRVRVSYCVSGQGFELKGLSVQENQSAPQTVIGRVKSISATRMVVCIDEGDNFDIVDGEPVNPPQDMWFHYGEACILNIPQETSDETDPATWDLVEVMYYEHTADQAEVQQLFDADSGLLEVPYEAVRVRTLSYQPEYRYVSNNNGTHRKINIHLTEDSVTEACTHGQDDVCPLCGYRFSQQPSAKKSNLAATGDGLGGVAAAAGAAAVVAGVAAVAASERTEE